MQVYYDKLISMLDTFPRHNSQRSVDTLSKILLEYKSILDIASNYNDDFKRNLYMHYVEIIDIEHHIKQSQTAKSVKQREQSFSDAINHLRDDIDDLARQIKPNG